LTAAASTLPRSRPNWRHTPSPTNYEMAGGGFVQAGGRARGFQKGGCVLPDGGRRGRSGRTGREGTAGWSDGARSHRDYPSVGRSVHQCTIVLATTHGVPPLGRRSFSKFLARGRLARRNGSKGKRRKGGVLPYLQEREDQGNETAPSPARALGAMRGTAPPPRLCPRGPELMFAVPGAHGGCAVR
jgi:hypothetical protein